MASVPSHIVHLDTKYLMVKTLAGNLIAAKRAEILAWKLRRKCQAKPEFSPKPLSNPSWTLTLVGQVMNIIYKTMNIINSHQG